MEMRDLQEDYPQEDNVTVSFSHINSSHYYYIFSSPEIYRQ